MNEGGDDAAGHGKASTPFIDWTHSDYLCGAHIWMRTQEDAQKRRALWHESVRGRINLVIGMTWWYVHHFLLSFIYPAQCPL